MRYGPDQTVLFKAAHMQHFSSGPHVWVLFGSGPWFEGDQRDCWVTLHLWATETDVVTRIEDPSESPFWASHQESERYLTREEVLSREGGKEWVIGRRLDFVSHHNMTNAFLGSLAQG
jgi:hypothetical protein